VKLNVTHLKTEEIKPNKALHRTAIPLCSIAVGKLEQKGTADLIRNGLETSD